MSLRTFTADRGDARERLDLVLRRHLTDVAAASRTKVQAWIERGDVAVNDVQVCRPSARTAFGDVVSVRLPSTTERRVMEAEEAAVDVLFEDDHLLAINKPAGLVVHPSYRNATGTLMNALLWRARNWPDGTRPSLVGRLDKLTSGVLMVAKTRSVHAALQQALALERSRKEYLAVVHGRVNVARGQIALKLSRDRHDRRRVVASPTTGVASLTRFERLARLAAPLPPLSLVRCTLVTGRMHQIRVHLAARGWPIVGDPVYGKLPDRPGRRATTAVPGFERQALHAWRLSLTHPITRAPLQIEAPLPRDFQELLIASRLYEGFVVYTTGARNPKIRYAAPATACPL